MAERFQISPLVDAVRRQNYREIMAEIEHKQACVLDEAESQTELTPVWGPGFEELEANNARKRR